MVKRKYNTCMHQIIATTRLAGHEASMIHTAKAIIMVTVLMITAFVFNGMDFFSRKSARCFWYKSDC